MLLVGAVVGLVAVLLTWASLRLCDAATGTASCGGGPGLLMLLAILIVLTYLGGWLLRGFGISDAGSTSFLAVGLLAVVAMLFLVDSLDAWTGVVAVPLRHPGGVRPVVARDRHAGRGRVGPDPQRDGRDQLGDLHGVERRALAQVVVADEQREPAVAVDARVLPQPADVRRVLARRLQRRRHVAQLHARRVGEQLARPLGRHRTLELGVDRQRVAGEHRHPHADARDPQVGDAEDLARLVAELLLLVGLVRARRRRSSRPAAAR